MTRLDSDHMCSTYYSVITEGCLYLESKESTTSPPNGCKFEGQYRYDGEVFVAADECNKCWCNKGEIICPFEDDCENIVARRRSLNAEWSIKIKNLHIVSKGRPSNQFI